MGRTDVHAKKTTFVWTGDEILNEYGDDGSPKASGFLGAAREGLSLPQHHTEEKHATTSPNLFAWNVSDGPGDVVALASDTGHLTDSYQYDPWGQLLRSQGTTYNPYRYVGTYGVRWDVAAGMYWMRARWYYPTVGRFISRDPLRTYNSYAYAGDNPVQYCIPTDGIM